ncbi:hypothetical protein ACUXOC_000234 [Corynebacterium mucifaciens]
MSEPDQFKLGVYAEEFRFMAPLIGPTRTVYRLADAYGLKVNSMRQALNRCGISVSLDEREVPA